jgi:hypothetical protein
MILALCLNAYVSFPVVIKTLDHMPQYNLHCVFVPTLFAVFKYLLVLSE